MRSSFILTTTLGLAVLFASGCGGDDDATGSTTSGLSTAFNNNCARCHGAEAKGGGKYPNLPGSLTVDAMIATVRAGRNEMPKFDAATISDADLRADYNWMKNVRK